MGGKVRFWSVHKNPAACNKIPKGISPEGGAEQNLPQDCSKIFRLHHEIPPAFLFCNEITLPEGEGYLCKEK
jgi:hypothetical protein